MSLSLMLIYIWGGLNVFDVIYFLGVHDYVCDGSMMGPFNGGYGWSLIDGALLMDPYWWCLGILSR